MRHKRSDYMRWAKTHQAARYNLATSGVGGFPLAALPFDAARLEINGNNSYGFRPLQSAIAARYGVDPDCVVEAAGTSMANHLAMAAILEEGDEAAIERPVYGPILDVALYLGADVKRFDRTEESGYQVDPEAVRRAVTPRTRLIVITNLHNPSSALTPEPVLWQIGEIAASVGAKVLVDEVYLDAVYEDTPRSSFHLGPEFVVTSSLTKIYGVSGLRAGWILARPELADRMRRLNDIYGATPAFPAEQLAVAVFENLEIPRERARRVVEADRAALARFLDEHAEHFAAPRTQWGTTSFVRLRHGDVDEFLERLRADYDTSAVPGRFFETPSSFRIGMGQDSETFAEGLRRLAQCATKCVNKG
jgi:aspartate/methionine/tyrosine aminotransferase